jgi:hypothetical protein
MSLIGFEGFDDMPGPPDVPLGSGQNLTGAQGFWALNGGVCNKITPGFGSLGSAMQPGSNTGLNCTLTTGFTRLIFGVRFNVPTTLNTDLFSFYTGASLQCGMYVNSSALLVFYGSSASTVLGTGTTVLSVGSWYYIEVDVTFNSSTGTFTVRLNGSGTEITASSVNTGGGGANQCTAFGFNRTGVTAGQGNYFDDLYLLDPTTGSSPFTSMLGPVRVETLFPNNTISVGPWVDATNVQYPIYNTSIAATLSLATGTCFFAPWTTGPNSAAPPAQGGQVSAIITRFSASYTGNVKVALYDATGTSGQPGALLGTSNVVNNPTGNATFASAPDITFTFPSPVTVQPNTGYWVAILCDTGTASIWARSGGNNNCTQAVAYVSGFPSTAAVTATATGNTPYLMATSTGSYALNLSQTASDGDTTYNVAGTTGQEIFGHNSLSLTPTTIFAAAVKSIVRKDQTSNPGLQNTLVSGATTQQGTTYNPATTYVGQKDIFLNDPNTAAAWTISGINNSQIGHNRTI